MNWRLTFGDQRRGGRGPRHYLEFALLSGCVMFASSPCSIDAQVPSVLAGLAAAVVAMVINGLVNRAFIHRQPGRLGGDRDRPGGAGWARHGSPPTSAPTARTSCPARGDASSGLPAGLLAHVIAHKRPVLHHRGGVVPRAAAHQHRDRVADAPARWSATTSCWRSSSASASRPAASTRPRSRRRPSPSRRSNPRSSPPRPTSPQRPRWLRLGPRPDRRGSPTAAGVFAPGRVTAGSGSGALRPLVLIGGDRGGSRRSASRSEGPSTAASMPAGVVFALALLALGGRCRVASRTARACRRTRSASAGGVRAGRGLADVAPRHRRSTSPRSTRRSRVWTPVVALVAVAEEVVLPRRALRRGARLGRRRLGAGRDDGRSSR